MCLFCPCVPYARTSKEQKTSASDLSCGLVMALKIATHTILKCILLCYSVHDGIYTFVDFSNDYLCGQRLYTRTAQ